MAGQRSRRSSCSGKIIRVFHFSLKKIRATGHRERQGIMQKRNDRQPYSLESIVELYPRLYSQKRLDEWMDLFDKRAIMVRVQKGNPVSFVSITEGITEQREYAAENALFDEKWHHVKINRHGNIAVIKANYILTAEREIRKGIDVLTLCCRDGGWRIVCLAYEQKGMVRRSIPRKDSVKTS